MNEEKRKIEYAPEAAKKVRNLDDHIRRRVGKSLKRLGSHPKLGKPLKGEENIYSYRFGTPGGEFRAIYRIKSDCILVVLVGTREEIYQILERSKYGQVMDVFGNIKIQRMNTKNIELFGS